MDTDPFQIERDIIANALKLNSTLEKGDEQYWVSEWLLRYGGSFARALGAALGHAALDNAEKIKRTWPNLWQEALENSTERIKNKDYY